VRNSNVRLDANDLGSLRRFPVRELDARRLKGEATDWAKQALDNFRLCASVE